VHTSVTTCYTPEIVDVGGLSHAAIENLTLQFAKIVSHAQTESSGGELCTHHTKKKKKKRIR
jgi:hypothetical protein